MPIFAVIATKGVIVSSATSGVSGPNVTKIVHNAEKFILFNPLTSELQSISKWQCDKEDWSAKNANFATLLGCYSNVP